MTYEFNINDMTQGNFWDSMCFDDNRQHLSRRRLFSNSNIGQLDYCNLHVPGRIGNYDSSFVIQRWYARSSILPEHAIEWQMLMRWAQRTYVHLVMGAQPQWVLPLYELFERRPRTTDPDTTIRLPSRDPWPLLVPVQQDISATIDSFDQDSLDHLAIYETTQRARVWIHVEGLSLPVWRGRAVDSLGYQDAVDKVVAKLIANERRHETTEERICDWLLGQMDSAEGEAAQHFSVVRDAIMEGKHRG